MKKRPWIPNLSHCLSHHGSSRLGSKGPSKRDPWIINLIREAGSLGWGRGGNGRPLSMQPGVPQLSVSPPGPGILPTSPHFTPQIKEAQTSPFALALRKLLYSWGLLIILTCRSFSGSLRPRVVVPSLFPVPREKPRNIHLDLCKVD